MFPHKERRRRKLLANRKKLADTRATDAKQDWSRQKQRLLKQN